MEIIPSNRETYTKTNRNIDKMYRNINKKRHIIVDIC